MMLHVDIILHVYIHVTILHVDIIYRKNNVRTGGKYATILYIQECVT